MTESQIYLDHAATTQPIAAAVEKMAEVQRQSFGNPSSPHGFGRRSHKLLEDAREFLRGSVGAAQVVFTSGGSEADLLGLAGAAMARSPGRIVVGAADHPAVLAQEDLIGRLRHRMTRVPVGPSGVLETEKLFDALGKDVRAVSLLHGHNELGSLCELEELVGMVRQVAPDAHVHVDLVQTFGKVPFDLAESGVDSIAVSAHKLGGPRGVGMLALRADTRIAALQPAGGQEEGLRGGTENVAGAAALAVAAEHALLSTARFARHTNALAAELFAQIQEVAPEAERLGDAERRLPHILSVRIPGVNTETLMERCQARGVAFSIGSACHGNESAQINPVLAAIGMDKRTARTVARFSFSLATTPDELGIAAEIITSEIDRLLDMAPRQTKAGNRSRK